MYAAVFVDAIVVKVRDGQVANRPIYAAIGVSLDGRRDVLGLWAGTGGEGAKFWMSVLTDISQSRHSGCVLPGLRRIERPAGSRRERMAGPRRLQTCVVHLIRNTFRLSGRQHWDALKHDLRPIYTAPTEAAAHAGLDDLAEHWGERYPAIIRLWTNAWQEFIPFLDYDTEIRRVLCSTNAIESPQCPLSGGR